jgi:glycerol-3-phosphate dehydrogenase
LEGGEPCPSLEPKHQRARKPNVADRIVDAVQHAAHVSHEARLVKSLAYDAIEDGAHEAKRAVKKSVQRGIEKLEAHRTADLPLAYQF